jgi:DNA-binding NarL/FixJ family response regulator
LRAPLDSKYSSIVLEFSPTGPKYTVLPPRARKSSEFSFLPNTNYVLVVSTLRVPGLSVHSFASLPSTANTVGFEVLEHCARIFSNRTEVHSLTASCEEEQLIEACRARPSSSLHNPSTQRHALPTIRSAALPRTRRR